MLILFNTLSLRLSRIMKMMMMVLNKSHVFFFVATNIVFLFLNTQKKVVKNLKLCIL